MLWLQLLALLVSTSPRLLHDPSPTPIHLPTPTPQVRDRATLYLYQLQRAPQGPESVDPQWRIPAKGLEAALAAYLEQPDTEQPFDLVGRPPAWGSRAQGGAALVCQPDCERLTAHPAMAGVKAVPEQCPWAARQRAWLRGF